MTTMACTVTIMAPGSMEMLRKARGSQDCGVVARLCAGSLRDMCHSKHSMPSSSRKAVGVSDESANWLTCYKSITENHHETCREPYHDVGLPQVQAHMMHASHGWHAAGPS